MVENFNRSRKSGYIKRTSGFLKPTDFSPTYQMVSLLSKTHQQHPPTSLESVEFRGKKFEFLIFFTLCGRATAQRLGHRLTDQFTKFRRCTPCLPTHRYGSRRFFFWEITFLGGNFFVVLDPYAVIRECYQCPFIDCTGQ